MSYLKLQDNGMSYPIRAYGSLGNLRRIMRRNYDSFEDWLNLGNRTVQNQNPLVLLLQQFSVNVEWTPDYLISVIDSTAQSNASLINLTGLYNRGKDHPLSIYPEVNHHTLLVVPFGSPDRAQINGYFTKELSSLIPLFPIYTTDFRQRWDLTKLMDTQTYKADTPIYTIIQIDIYALVIGFYRWLKSGRTVGNSPHAYIANFPLMNCYMQHNELVNFNYLNEKKGFMHIDKAQFSIEPYLGGLDGYTEWKNDILKNEAPRSFTEFIQFNRPSDLLVDQTLMIYPPTYKSLSFMQMSWVWSLASLGMVQKYLAYLKASKGVDGLMMAQLRDYYKNSLSIQLNQIKDQYWETHFSQIWNDTKTYI